MSECTHTTIDSPIGQLTLVATDGVLTGLYTADHRHRPATDTFGGADDDAFGDVVTQLDEYFAGTRTDFDLELRAVGTPFRRAVWTALREIPYGETVSYGWVARRIGAPAAARAVGAANGANPISIIVPCHRVIGSAGSLTGYAGGLDRKRSLLDLERRAAPLYCRGE